MNAGEYALAALLAMTFIYTLAFSHTNHTPFSSSSQHSKHWWKSRFDVSGWMEQHQQYANEAVLASQSSVCTSPQFDRHSTLLQKHCFATMLTCTAMHGYVQH